MWAALGINSPGKDCPTSNSNAPRRYFWALWLPWTNLTKQQNIKLHTTALIRSVFLSLVMVGNIRKTGEWDIPSSKKGWECAEWKSKILCCKPRKCLELKFVNALWFITKESFHREYWGLWLLRVPAAQNLQILSFGLGYKFHKK